MPATAKRILILLIAALIGSVGGPAQIIMGQAASGGGATPGGSTGNIQYNTAAGAFGGAENIVPSELALAPAPTAAATCAGTCASTWTYSTAAISPVGRSQHPAGPTVTATNAAALDVTHYNTITPGTCQTYQTGFDVFRLAPMGTGGTVLIGTAACGVTLRDDGLVALGPQPYTFDDQDNPGSQGLAVTGTLRATGLNGLVVAPDYLLQASQVRGSLLAGFADTVVEEIVDGSYCTSPTTACHGFYHAYTVYHSGAVGRSKVVAQQLLNAHMWANGTATVDDYGVQDYITNKYLFDVDVTGHADQTGNTEGTMYVNNVSADGYMREALHTPASSTEACLAGQFADDTGFHYVCTATNTWKRVALSSF